MDRRVSVFLLLGSDAERRDSGYRVAALDVLNADVFIPECFLYFAFKDPSASVFAFIVF